MIAHRYRPFLFFMNCPAEAEALAILIGLFNGLVVSIRKTNVKRQRLGFFGPRCVRIERTMRHRMSDLMAYWEKAFR